MRRGFVRTLVGTAMALGAGLALGACSGEADAGYIRRYSAHYTLDTDGSMQVDLEFDYVPPASGWPGPVLRIPVQVATDDPAVDRLYPLSKVSVSSPTGAPTETRTDVRHGITTVQVGNPADKVGGQQTYRVSYTQRGVIDQIGNRERFAWNVFASSRLPIKNASAVISAPAPASKASCYSGEKKGKRPCSQWAAAIGDQTPYQQDRSGWVGADPADAGYFQTAIELEDYFTIDALYPAGTFPDSRVLTGDPQVRTAYVFEWDRMSVGVAIGGGVVLVALLAGLVTWPLYRDARAGKDPLADGVQDAPRARTTPPDGLYPGEVSVLASGEFLPKDLSAMMADLTNRGALSITDPTADPAAISTGAPVESGRPNWRLAKTGRVVPLTAGEQQLMDQLFDRSTAVKLSSLTTRFGPLTSAVRAQVFADVFDRGWFKRRPSARGPSCVLGIASAISFLVCVIGCGPTGDAGWAGPWFIASGGVFLACLLGFLFSARRPGRTSQGMQVYRQSQSFEEYLTTVSRGEAPPPRDPQNLVPWAIAYGLADGFVEVTMPPGTVQDATAYPWWSFATLAPDQFTVAARQGSSQPAGSGSARSGSARSGSGSRSPSGSSSTGRSAGGGRASDGGGGTGGGDR